MNAAMSEQDLPSLIATQRRLLREKTVILDMLKLVRNETHKLQVKWKYNSRLKGQSM